LSPNGALYHSPGLRAALPWVMTTIYDQPHRGCVKFDAGTRTQPIQGCRWGGPRTQGSTCGATLGFGMQPRWGCERHPSQSATWCQDIYYMTMRGERGVCKETGLMDWWSVDSWSGLGLAAQFPSSQPLNFPSSLSSLTIPSPL
jgi:hypothetical protein